VTNAPEDEQHAAALKQDGYYFAPLRVIAAGILPSAIGDLLVPFTTGAALVSAAFVGGIGVAIVSTNSDAMVRELAREGGMAATVGAAGSVKELGDMVASLLIGVLSHALGLRAGFIVCGALVLAALGLLRTAPAGATQNFRPVVKRYGTSGAEAPRAPACFVRRSLRVGSSILIGTDGAGKPAPAFRARRSAAPRAGPTFPLLAAH
jgi:hypothetical protein